MEVKVSVRNLVEFILRYGDIDDRTQAGSDPDAMQAGSRIHRKIQKSMPSGYSAEVVIKKTIEDEDIQLIVEGRADGVWIKDDKVIIDEIKSMYADVYRLTKPKKIHLAQAKCYGAIYAESERLSDISIQMTYCNIETEAIQRFMIEYKAEELIEWFYNLTKEYLIWAHYINQHMIARDNSIKKLEFPYEYREGQKKIVIDVFRVIRRSANLFIEAPTGVGKTLSTVYPALKALGEGLTSKIFYLTAKTITRTVAQDTLKLLSDRGLEIKSVTITAKEKFCINEVFECNPDACVYASGHFDRVNAAVFEIINQEDVITREIIEKYAKHHKLCPYEFCLDISNWCDVIIGDYNYAFDTRVKLKRYFSEGIDGDYLFLIDEAHNLVPRACEMYSASIVKEDIIECKKITKGLSTKLNRALERCNKKMLEIKKTCEDMIILDDVNALDLELMKLINIFDALLEEQKNFDARDKILEFYFKLRKFLDIYETAETGYKIYAKMMEDGSFIVKLMCINPANNLRECLDKSKSAIFFSATLLPIKYYKELLTGDKDAYAIYAPSPFDIKNRLLAIGRDVSSRYTRRGDNEYNKIAFYIETMINVKPGNYMVFFPSYEFMSHVENILRKKFSEENLDAEAINNINYKLSDINQTRIVTQNSHMDDIEKEDFLAEFDNNTGQVLIGLCVMGGVFAEGIDLANERLIGAIVVGTGLPMLNTESEITKKYFDELGKPGFSYAYQYPGMNKVMQAAGRVIRTKDDKGIILLLDDRFLHREYIKLFPKEWQNFKVTTVDKVELDIDEFWRQIENY